VDPLTATASFVLIGAVLVVLVISQSRRSSELIRALAQLASESGWADIQTSQFLGVRVRGTWNGYAAELQRRAREKSRPELMVTRIRVQVPARIGITRKQRGFRSGRPLTLFGPPIVDYPPAAQFWLRSDEVSLVERLFATSVPAMLDQNLSGRFDSVRLGRDALVIQRQSEWKAERSVRVAREELELAKAIIDALALRG
jgi:hypothetical protein